MVTDTDSLYIAFARDTIDECVKPELKEQWNTEKWNWFCSEDVDTLVEFRGGFITKKQYDSRRIPWHRDGVPQLKDLYYMENVRL